MTTAVSPLPDFPLEVKDFKDVEESRATRGTDPGSLRACMEQRSRSTHLTCFGLMT